MPTRLKPIGHPSAHAPHVRQEPDEPHEPAVIIQSGEGEATPRDAASFGQAQEALARQDVCAGRLSTLYAAQRQLRG